MKMKQLFFLFLLTGVLIGSWGCGKEEKAGESYYLQPDEVNYYMLKENPQDLSPLGSAINGTKNMIVALDGPTSDYVLNSLSSLGEVEATDLSMDFNLNGEGDINKIKDLVTVKGLTQVTVAGINKFNDVTPYVSLPYLTKLTLKDQIIDDFMPLSQSESLKTLCLSGETINYTTLMELPMENMEIPVAENNWVALNLLKNNESLATINSVSKESFNINEYLDDEQKYYYFQFEDTIFLTTKKQEITGTSSETPSLGKTIAIAASENLLQPPHYTDQAMLNTACNIQESTKNPVIFFPYIKEYSEEEGSTFLKLAGTDFMEEQFLTAIDAQEAETYVYVYALDEGGNFTTDYAQGQRWIYAQIYQANEGIAYEPYLLYQSALEDPKSYQNEILYALNEYLKGIS